MWTKIRRLWRRSARSTIFLLGCFLASFFVLSLVYSNLQKLEESPTAVELTLGDVEIGEGKFAAPADKPAKNKISNPVEVEKPAEDSLVGARDMGLPVTLAPPVSDNANAEKKTPLPMDLVEAMRRANSEQVIRNQNVFGPVTNETIVIAIQVHNRHAYLKNLIHTLSLARDIDKTLLVFSHDLWDEEMNSLVQGVDFAKVAQIFYPFSIQVNPDQFPGDDPSDCKRGEEENKSKRENCVNSGWADSYGHYREAKYTQTKHHWWWKANVIFDKLAVTRNHNGLVLFLEEDHYVAEDFLYVLRKVESYRRTSNCEDCDIICLGTYLKAINFAKTHKSLPMRQPQQQPRFGRYQHVLDEDVLFGGGHKEGLKGPVMGLGGAAGLSPWSLTLANRPQPPEPELGLLKAKRRLLWNPRAVIDSMLESFSRVEKTLWLSSRHNMGMAFDRNFWNKIYSCRQYFCYFDDYNWDWSLFHISNKCLPQPVKTLLVKAPRVFHVGECGVHHKKKECDSAKAIERLRKILSNASKYLYPENIVVTTAQAVSRKKKLKIPKGNGGWGDQRDRKLCMNLSNVTLSESQTLLDARYYREP